MRSFKLYMLSVMNDKRKTIDACIAGIILSAISFAYLVILKCVYFLIDAGISRPVKIPAKVISAGNITLGGTGKTPFTIMLAEKAKAAGKKTAVLTRGYGDDETHLLKNNLSGIPVIASADRIAAARRAIKEFGSECLILDDGFQHRRLERDLNIVLIDTTAPIGNIRLFPRGVLREPLSRLREADIVVLTKSDMGANNKAGIYERLRSIKSGIKISESVYKVSGLKDVLSDTILPLSYVKGRRAALLAGIANPDYFEWMVKNMGADPAEKFYYADHHLYGERDINEIMERCAAAGISIIITTEKDIARRRGAGSNRLADLVAESPAAKKIGIELLALKIDFVISKNEEEIVAGLRSVFNR